MSIQDLTASLDLKQNLNIYATCKQFDNLNLILSVYDNSLQADLSNYDVRLRAMKADNVPLIQQHVGIDINSNIVNIQADGQLTTTAGNTPVELQFIDKSTGLKKATFNLVLVVVASAIAIEASISKATYTLLEELENKIDQCSDFLENIDTAINANNELEATITNSETAKSNLDGSISTGNTLKTNLDNTFSTGNTLKSNLESDISTGNTLKTNLESSITTGDNLLDSLENFESQHADVTDISNHLSIIDSSLSKLAKFKLIADIAGTDYKAGDFIDYGYIRTQQEILYGSFYRKLFKYEAVKICCRGDSLTNGQDTVSADARPVTADTTHVSGEPTSSQTIASTTYPEALQSNLQSILGSQVTVINQGYSGDWVKNGYFHYPNNNGANITFIMYGTNDPRASWVPDDIRGNIEAYINWYEQMIIRDILWGSAVVILTPPKLRFASDVDIKTFSIPLNALGEKYGVPVIDTTEFTANYPSTIHCDDNHFKGEGYKVIGAKVTALCIGEGAKKPMCISDGETLLTRPNIDNLQYFGSAVFQDASGSVQTPAEDSQTTGVIASWTGIGSGVIYSFYTEENDMMILQFYYSSTGNIRLTLDFNTASPQNMDDLLVDANVSLTETLTKQVVYSSPTIPSLSDLIKATGDSSQPTLIRISEKGWHTLKVDATDSNAIVSLNAIHFMNYRNYKQQRDILFNQANITSLQPKRGFYYALTHSTYSSNPTVITETRIKVSDLLTAIGRTDLLTNADYWKHPPFKLTLMNYQQSIIEYEFFIGSLGDGANTTFLGEINRKNIATTPTERTITNVTLDTSTQEIVLTWGGANRVANFVIGLAY